MLKLTHIADVHLEKSLGKKKYPSSQAYQRRMEVYDSLRNLLASENEDVFIIAGDLFEHEYLGHREELLIADIFAAYPEKRIIICPGNHDPLASYENINFTDNVYVFNRDRLDYFEFEDIKTRVYGIAWEKSAYSARTLNVELDENYYNILVLHGDISGDGNYMSFNLDNLTGLGFDYIALGHIHKGKRLTERIAYAGSFEPFSFGETGEKGYISVVLDGDKIAYDFTPHASRIFIEKDLYIDESMTSEQMLSQIRSLSDQKNFYRIYLKGRINLQAFEALTTILEISRDSFYYVEFVQDYLQVESMDAKDPALNELFSYIDNSDKDETVKLKAKEKLLYLKSRV